MTQKQLGDKFSSPSGVILALSKAQENFDELYDGDQVVGAATAAAGTTTADAGVLPAATGTAYPTTAADGTKGVRIHADDQVLGRTLFIGNGVSNQVLKVYAPSGGAINGAAADAAFSSASGKGVIIICTSATSNTWNAF